MLFNKLVRDKIPEIIEADGYSCKTRILSDEEYLHYLKLKIREEALEFFNDPSNSIEELADILEAVYATANALNCSIEQLEHLRKAKVDSRGAFEKRILLEYMEKEGK